MGWIRYGKCIIEAYPCSRATRRGHADRNITKICAHAIRAVVIFGGILFKAADADLEGDGLYGVGMCFREGDGNADRRVGDALLDIDQIVRIGLGVANRLFRS